jgi:hypothetical protein
MSDAGDIQDRLAGTIALDEGGQDGVYKLFDFVVPYAKTAADGMASTATTDTLFWSNPFDFSVKVASATLIQTTGVTASDTNYATVQIKTDNGAGGATAVAAAISTTTTDSGNITANIKKNLTVTAANATVVSGGNLYFAITKTGAGVVVNAGFVHVRVRRT